ncbi:ArsR/SmtB family transcription factor [Actinomadura rudentiformis]|uniref:Winged helix-turn-helix transcriptional regulator n=1 Tax=Actinomadura rudentiformis TaxID=359158 RepID=A0A6H9YPF7_9ACTN|nr:winged helix-turn-helix domain-containing protein [Actinomadura rudentiformis]KAB2349035.1 winged helix-turn-helix transcriptional regulator [Actinomadura rudentiformis]
MGWWQINADTLARGRFVISPLAETTAALKTLHHATAAHPGERTWLDTHLPAYRRRLTADPVTALLIHAALGPTWNATFLTPAPGDDATFDQELARVRATPPDAARTDLGPSLQGPLPTALDRDDLPERAAGLLRWVWIHTVHPTWPHRRRVIEADIVARTAHLGHGGWAAAVGDLRPGMRWLGGDRLQITTHDHPPRHLTGDQLMFVPVTPHRTWLAWDDTHRRSAVVYPCSATLTTARQTPAAASLAALLGPVRAAVLTLLDTPKSTTQLVALTGHGLGSVGRHLKVLLDAHLVQRRRAGRSVLYYRTGTGDALVQAQEHP